MTSISIPAHGNPLARIGLQRKLAMIVAIVAFADWLFYGQAIGISIVIFIVTLAEAVLIANPAQVTPRRMIVAGGILVASLLPLIEDCGLLSCLFGVFGIAYFAVAMTALSVGDLRMAAARLLLWGPFQVFPDLMRAGKISRRTELTILNIGAITIWVIPVVLGGVFVALFASANPIIEGLLSHIDFEALLAAISFPRILFWLAVIIMTWPFIFMAGHIGRPAKALVVSSGVDLVTEPSQLFGAAAILRSLLLFNLIFAIQTIMDVTYLWGGLALPDGMTHATYAHRGAYPLIVTALLAGGFVIAAMQPGSAGERTPVIRNLVYVWIAQNVLLVLSSILRLDLYVEAYSLTYLRAAAFIWMIVVAFGLILIVARIALRRSNSWLIRANADMLLLIFYACCFINFPFVIATYNVAHCREVSGNGVSLDEAYLVSLGPEIIPAMDAYKRSGHDFDTQHLGVYGWGLSRDQFVALIHADIKNWRAWSFRTLRLMRYLDETTTAIAPGT